MSAVDAPIGIFDSGYGGLTVLRAVLDQLPQEATTYFGDTARAPYGPRPIAQTRQYALECLDRLVEHGVKVLVIACNTASAAVLHDARERYDVPVVEVIRPAVRRAVLATRTDRVGVISTVGTHQSGAYVDAFTAAPHLRVLSQPCPRFVEFVESGTTGGQENHRRRPRLPRAAAGRGGRHARARLHALPLAHRRHLLRHGRRGDARLVGGGDGQDVYRVLADRDLLRPDDAPPPGHGFTTTGDAEEFRRLARRFLGPEVGSVFGNMRGVA